MPQTLPNWRERRDELTRWLKAGRIGVISDMDGTLSPIVPHPDDARPTEANRQALGQLHEHLALVAVVSGRAVADVRAKMALPHLVYAGNHGLERWVADDAGGRVEASPAVAPYLDALQTIKAQITADAPGGVWVEDKRVTLSIHYRAHANPAQFRESYLDHMQNLTQAHGLKLFEGRMIFEVRPPLAIDKGTVFAQLIEDYALDGACFIGDDVTDADAFRVAQTLRQSGRCQAWAIGVESARGETPQAVLASSDMLASGVDDVASLLGWLLEAVSASST